LFELKKMRKEQGLTQFDLAKACNVSVVSIRLWEAEISKPNEENLQKLKNVLGVD